MKFIKFPRCNIDPHRLSKYVVPCLVAIGNVDFVRLQLMGLCQPRRCYAVQGILRTPVSLG